MKLKILLKTYRGEELLETVDVEIPSNVPSGRVSLMVADAGTLSAVERREARHGFVPKNMSQLVRAINTLRKNNRLYVRLSRAGAGGAIVDGEYMSSLPPSVLNVLETDESGSGYTRLRNSTIWEHELVTDYNVSGARVLNLQVKKR